jgi:hypothetical protein
VCIEERKAKVKTKIALKMAKERVMVMVVVGTSPVPIIRMKNRKVLLMTKEVRRGGEQISVVISQRPQSPSLRRRRK